MATTGIRSYALGVRKLFDQVGTARGFDQAQPPQAWLVGAGVCTGRARSRRGAAARGALPDAGRGGLATIRHQRANVVLGTRVPRPPAQETSRAELVAVASDAAAGTITAAWRLEGRVSLPLRPRISPFVVVTTLGTDAAGLVCSQVDAFEVPGWRLLAGALLGAWAGPPAAPPVDELRAAARAAGREGVVEGAGAGAGAAARR